MLAFDVELMTVSLSICKIDYHKSVFHMLKPDFKKNVSWSYPRKEKNILETVIQQNVYKMFSSTRFILHIYCDQQDMDIKEFYFLLTKEI